MQSTQKAGTVTLAQALVQIMVKEGVADAFGIPGAGINPVYQYLASAPIRHYIMRHEEACVHAAGGYYRASHKIALAICTSGPGATNFVTGLYTNYIDSIPVLAITGQANTWQMDREPFQCVDIGNICKTVTKKAYCVKNAQDLPDVMREAFHLMRSGRPGPVLIDLPLDVQTAQIAFDIENYQPLPVQKPAPSPEDVEKACDLLARAARPAIVMGGGVVLSEACADLVALAQRLQIPVITTYMAKGGIPEDHPLNAGHAGIQVGQPIGNAVLQASDLVLGIGCRFCDRHTGDLAVYRGGRKFIHVDIEPGQLGRVFPPDLGVVSDAGAFIRALGNEADKRGMQPFDWALELPQLRGRLARRTDYDGRPMVPHRLFAQLNQAFDDDAMFTTGCGITQIWSGQLQKAGKPMRYLPSGGAGTLGFEVPAAFGAKVAQPHLFSAAVVGDFGFTFRGEEIAVAAMYDKPIIVVILNNAYLGLIRQNQLGAYGFEYAVDMPYNQDGRIDYVKVAQGYGCLAERVDAPQQLAQALERAKRSGRTYVIDALCQPKQLCDMGASIAAIKCFAPQGEEGQSW